MLIQNIPIKDRAYKEQYETMKRWYWRLQPYLGVGEKTMFSKIDTYPSDFFEAFFINCYHLRDHLILSGIDQKEVDKFIDTSLPLKLCADICNITKHVKLVRKSRMSSEVKLNVPLVSYQNEDGQEFISSMLVIQDDENLYDPLGLAGECVQEWNRFLESKSLPIPELTEERIFQCFDKNVSD